MGELIRPSVRNSPELSSRKRFLTDFWEAPYMTISLFVSVKDPELREAARDQISAGFVD